MRSRTAVAVVVAGVVALIVPQNGSAQVDTKGIAVSSVAHPLGGRGHLSGDLVYYNIDKAFALWVTSAMTVVSINPGDTSPNITASRRTDVESAKRCSSMIGGGGGGGE